ncbi:MAG: TonB-dependent receptor plug domain-containing protein, partial [Chromatiales bacterium]
MKQYTHHFRRPLLVTLVAAVVHGPTFAEEVQLPAITVTESQPLGAQLNATDIDAKTLQILRPATSDTASLLRNIPGVNLQNAGGVSSLPVIRGMADDRLRIKVDGMDLISACGN